MMSTAQQMSREADKARADKEREIAQKQNAARLQAAEGWAAQQNAVFDEACKIQNLQRREAKLIGYVTSLKAGIAPLVAEKHDLLVEFELNGTDAAARLAQIDQALNDSRAALARVTGELGELQTELRKKLTWLANNKTTGELH